MRFPLLLAGCITGFSGLLGFPALSAWAQLKPGLHPEWELEELRLPEKYRVMGIDFLPDGRMVVAASQYLPSLGMVPEASDEACVLVISHYGGNDSASIRVKIISKGWKDPSGINVVDGEIYVSDRDGHYKIIDKDSPPDPGQNRVRIAAWPVEGWHQWVFTPVWRKGRFYAPYSGSLTSSGWSKTPASSELSGAMLTWDMQGRVSAFAGGLRSPNGANADPAGNIFVVDNQGCWLPGSTFSLMKEGKFYGHRQSTPEPPNFAESLPYQMPSVWLPHGDMRKSPSQPVHIPSGSYQGDWLLGDINYTGLVRIALDEVGDEMQGGVFWFSQGFKSLKGEERLGGLAGDEANNPPAINRLAFGPDGNLYVGTYAGIGGNWPDRTLMPLYVMRPRRDTSVFDFKAVRVLKDGLELHFTHPVDSSTLPATLLAKTQRYARDSLYTCCRQNLADIPLTLKAMSQDGLRAHYKGDLVADVVMRFDLASAKSARGEALWNNEVHYTLNWLSNRKWNAVTSAIKQPQPPRYAIAQGLRAAWQADGLLRIYWDGNSGAKFEADLEIEWTLIDLNGKALDRKQSGRKGNAKSGTTMQVELDPKQAGRGVYFIRVRGPGLHFTQRVMAP